MHWIVYADLSYCYIMSVLVCDGTADGTLHVSPGHPSKLDWKHLCCDVPGSSSYTGCYLVTNPVICLAEILFHSSLHNKLFKFFKMTPDWKLSEIRILWCCVLIPKQVFLQNSQGQREIKVDPIHALKLELVSEYFHLSWRACELFWTAIHKKLKYLTEWVICHMHWFTQRSTVK